MLNLAEMSNAVKQLTHENAVRDKFGDSSCRLYRLLLRKHVNGECVVNGMCKFEPKQLAELAVMPEKDARPLMMPVVPS